MQKQVCLKYVFLGFGDKFAERPNAKFLADDIIMVYLLDILNAKVSINYK
jgi:hypothetical protein